MLFAYKKSYNKLRDKLAILWCRLSLRTKPMCRGAGVGCGERFPEEKAELPEASIEAPCIKRAQESNHLGASQNSYRAISRQGHAYRAVANVGRSESGLVQGSVPKDDSIFIIKRTIFSSFLIFLNIFYCIDAMFIL